MSRAAFEEVCRENALFEADRDDPECGYRFLADEVHAAGVGMADRTAWWICQDNRWWSVFARDGAGTRRPTRRCAMTVVQRDSTAAGSNRL
ncbi:hypothetical protein ACIQU5_36790 [Streptomyces sp. NPDC090306]|uniref:hypothetical protein n=1 Tax=Streptomyces sp. NPDC090306 TaxID=3365961 RepID=UPI00380765A3